MNTTPYDDRSDLDKLKSQWTKIGGIVSRNKEWSAAIVRAATAAEIAANIATRRRFESAATLSDSFVDSLLLWANGIDGKFKRLIIPAEVDASRLSELKALYKLAEKLNLKRNAIVHRGLFSDRAEALETIELAREIVEGLVKPYHPDFALSKPIRGRKLALRKPRPSAKKVPSKPRAQAKKATAAVRKKASRVDEQSQE